MTKKLSKLLISKKIGQDLLDRETGDVVLYEGKTIRDPGKEQEEGRYRIDGMKAVRTSFYFSQCI